MLGGGRFCRLVAFDGPASSMRYFGVQLNLEDLDIEAALLPELLPLLMTLRCAGWPWAGISARSELRRRKRRS